QGRAEVLHRRLPVAPVPGRGGGDQAGGRREEETRGSRKHERTKGRKEGGMTLGLGDWSKAREAAMPRVSLCMIVRDEEANLPRCLRSAADLVDEMVVVDTGSADGTREFARRLGARVVDFAWVDSFAAARNASLDHATGEWIFWLDADEYL